MNIKNVICFDLEGPLSPQDNAYEVMGLIPGGREIFEVLSAYDDILSVEGRKNYEPGDTLSLIVPFILYHGITDRQITDVSNTARIVDGAGYTIKYLRKKGFEPHIISTSYHQHALNIGAKLSVPKDRIYCTRLPLDRMMEELHEIDFSPVERVEKDIKEEIHPNIGDTERIKKRLDDFFWKELFDTKLGTIMDDIKVIGGQRKVNAVHEILTVNAKNREDAIVVGDSITDFKMLKSARDNGGLAIAFNGNEFAAPYANIALATTDMRALIVIVEAYMKGGRENALKTARTWEEKRENFAEDPGEIPDEIATDEIKKFLSEMKERDEDFEMPHMHFIDENVTEEKIKEIIGIHKRFRKAVRGEAAKLG